MQSVLNRPRKTPVVLMVDDDADDIYLTRRAFKGIDFAGTFEDVCGAVELFERLGMSGSDTTSVPTDAVLPDIVMLDLNMPGINGFDVLARIRRDEKLNQLPVVVLSTSDSERDIQRSYALGANSFICKPASNTAMQELVTRFRDYWFGLSVLPRLL